MGSRRYSRATCSITEDFIHPRLRSLIGTVVIICLVVIYAVAATAIASATLAQSPWWVHLAYFVLSGVLWILPAMLIIKWMAGPKKQD